MPTSVSSVRRPANAMRTLEEAIAKHAVEPLMPELDDRGFGRRQVLPRQAQVERLNQACAVTAIDGLERALPAVADALGQVQGTFQGADAHPRAHRLGDHRVQHRALCCFLAQQVGPGGLARPLQPTEEVELIADVEARGIGGGVDADPSHLR